jgi:hypothetical protein
MSTVSLFPTKRMEQTYYPSKSHKESIDKINYLMSRIESQLNLTVKDTHN